MSIAAVVTRGYGSFGSIAEVTTRGYIAGVAPTPTATVGGFPKKRYRYRASLDDGTVIWGDSAQQVRELKKRYEKTVPEPVKAKAKIKVEKTEYTPPDPVFYAEPIPNVFTRINLKGDPNALIAKLAIELEADDEEAINAALALFT